MPSSLPLLPKREISMNCCACHSTGAQIVRFSETDSHLPRHMLIFICMHAMHAAIATKVGV